MDSIEIDKAHSFGELSLRLKLSDSLGAMMRELRGLPKEHALSLFEECVVVAGRKFLNEACKDVSQ
jgi:hypothetical protein